MNWRAGGRPAQWEAAVRGGGLGSLRVLVILQDNTSAKVENPARVG